ncbi:unnamed protein product [Blepharisma stoltei]|uniref:Tetratricopeptide repeat protein n=1 Tax=Blepharisma stoltei TaxID=1481888 RepID=A0AAU9J0Q6_9CILI|nr:unnamed protein product [Blepharisma stoltei]
MQLESTQTYYDNKGNALDELGRREEAMESYKKAIKIDSNNNDAYNDIGDAFYHEKKYEEALKHSKIQLESN